MVAGFFNILWQTIANSRQILSKDFTNFADKVIEPSSACYQVRVGIEFNKECRYEATNSGSFVDDDIERDLQLRQRD